LFSFLIFCFKRVPSQLLLRMCCNLFVSNSQTKLIDDNQTSSDIKSSHGQLNLPVICLIWVPQFLCHALFFFWLPYCYGDMYNCYLSFVKFFYIYNFFGSMPRKRELESRFSAFFVQNYYYSPFLSHIDIYSKSLFKQFFAFAYIIEYLYWSPAQNS